VNKMIEIPNISLPFSRDLMPQIRDEKSFIATLKKNDVSYTESSVSPLSLKATQMEFDIGKVEAMMLKPSKSKVIVSNDNYILDGHHRWLVAHNKKQKLDIIRVDLPILELIAMSKRSLVECVKNVIRESLTNKKYK
jgi:hypothetical protein